ncbi:hypothetical protein NMY22_g5650 [Coprinellus aureogranulatus]|nr:hypothetical protein NMY22_g5650 [Coprinellus aureogranulatus]
MSFVYPTASVNLAGKILVVPIVSTANVAQLAADLLVATLSLRQIAILDPSYCIPVVGGREDGVKGVTTPLELFSSSESKIVVIQQRSPVLVKQSRKQETPTYQIRLPQFHMSLLGTGLQNLEQLPIPVYRSQGSEAENPSTPFIPGGGLTRRILNSIPEGWAIPAASLLQFVLEGDNAADAAMLASAVVGVLELTIPNGQLKAPTSWKAGLFGSPHDQSLYG